MKTYEVIVGNIGTVHSGSNLHEALAVYREYVDQSEKNYGRAAGESVTLMRDGIAPLVEYIGKY